MNNDLEQFSEERLKQLASGKYAGTGLGIQNREVAPLARIALAAKQAKPVAWEVKGILCHTKEEADVFIGEPEPLYDTPQTARTEQDGWIKCSDRMPDHKVNVLAATSCGSIWTAFYNENRNCWDDGDYYDDIINVTHWMPLPAAPKPESE